MLVMGDCSCKTMIPYSGNSESVGNDCLRLEGEVCTRAAEFRGGKEKMTAVGCSNSRRLCVISRRAGPRRVRAEEATAHPGYQQHFFFQIKTSTHLIKSEHSKSYGKKYGLPVKI